MEGFLSTFPPYNVYGNPVCASPAQVGNWGKRDGRFMNPQSLNYLELYKTLLSQVNPSLPPQLKKANTKECGVQVNARVDKIVQCSLGPKTLFFDEFPTPCKLPTSPDASTPEEKAQCHTPPMSNLRFLRPVSIYSPVFDRRLFLKKLEDCAGEGEGEAAAEQATSEADGDQSGEEAPEDSKTAFHRSPKGSNFQVDACGEMAMSTVFSFPIHDVTQKSPSVIYGSSPQTIA